MGSIKIEQNKIGFNVNFEKMIMISIMKHIMRYIIRHINCLLGIIAAISLWGILSIGIGLISLIPFCPVSSSVNDCLLQLSYGYISGYTIYILTVCIPFYMEKRQHRERILYIIRFLFKRIFRDYLLLYGSEIDELNGEKKIQIDKYVLKGFGSFLSFGKTCVKYNTFELVEITYRELRDSRNDFIQTMQILSKYLSNSERDILFELERFDLSIKIDSTAYLGTNNFMHSRKDKYKLHFEPFTNYILLLIKFMEVISPKAASQLYFSFD